MLTIAVDLRRKRSITIIEQFYMQITFAILKTQGLITEEEFVAMKAKIISR